MQDLLNDTGRLFIDLFENIAIVMIIIGFFRWSYKIIKRQFTDNLSIPLLKSNKTNDTQNKQIDAILVSMEAIANRLASIEDSAKAAHAETNKNIMRIQILDGIARHEFSESQVKEKYDEYHAFGGNSDVTDRVHDYIELLKEEKKQKK